MSSFLTLTLSTLKIFIRNRQALFFSLVTPLIIMTIFGLIGFDRLPKTDVGIVTDSPNEPTQDFIERLKNNPALTVRIDSRQEAQQALLDDNRSVIFLIPGNLIPQDPSRPAEPKNVVAISTASGQQQAQAAISILGQALDKANISLAGAPVLYNLENRIVNSRGLKYIDFLLPGIIGLAIMQMAVFSVAFVFADYKEKGILKRVLATPVKPYRFVAANVITRLLIALLQAAILVAVGVLLFNAKVAGSYPLIFLIAMIGAMMFLALGFAISGLASTVETVPALANIIVFPMLFLGGTFFPINTMPDWLQNVARTLPLTYFSTALRDVMTKDAGFSEITQSLLWMLGWFLVFIFLANLTFKFGEKRI